MAIKYLDGKRIRGTSTERLALTDTDRTQDYAGILSTYDPYFFLKLDEGSSNFIAGTASITNSGSGSEAVAINQPTSPASANPSWTAASSGFAVGGYAVDFDASKSYAGMNTNPPSISVGGDVDGGNTEVWSIMILIKFIGAIPSSNMIMGYRGDPFNNMMGVGTHLGGTTLRFGSATYSGGWSGSSNDTDLVADTWMTLGITNTTSGVKKHYLNGVLDGTETLSGGGNGKFNGLNILGDNDDHWVVDSVFYDNATLSDSNMAGVSAKMMTVGDPEFTYPNIPAGTIFEETNTYKYYMWDGTSEWTVVNTT